jgi:hypothetical protein
MARTAALEVGGLVAMQRATNREDCYATRDELFKCFDTHGMSAAPCKDVNARYEAKCPASWRNYFGQQRERQKVLELQADISRQKSGREMSS